MLGMGPGGGEECQEGRGGGMVSGQGSSLVEGRQGSSLVLPSMIWMTFGQWMEPSQPLLCLPQELGLKGDSGWETIFQAGEGGTHTRGRGRTCSPSCLKASLLRAVNSWNRGFSGMPTALCQPSQTYSSSP